ncbi:MAG: protein kinase [Bacillaceae bacterium]|nr:protein kinase [Bacillaceae bacterium]
MNHLRHYQKLNFIGSGWFGKVYSGYHSFTNQKVAIKEMMDLGKARHEINVMKYRYSHYLPTVYDVFYQDNKAYIVMEFIPGAPLGGEDFTNGRIRDEMTSVKITINILEALNELHQHGFAHNDILPKNIMMNGEDPDTVRLIDFGSAFQIRTDEHIRLDLKNVAKICLYLINGYAPDVIKGGELRNTHLNNILLDVFTLDDYKTTKHFINALR